MTDKYEEFKEWWSRKGFTTNPFIEFEEEQAEKEKEREIKRTIKEALKDQRCNLYAIDGYAYVVYKALKEKDLIK